MTTRLPADRLAGQIGQHLLEQLWDRTSVLIGGVVYSHDETAYDDAPDDDTLLVLRGPDGRSYEVEIQVEVTDYTPPPEPATAVTEPAGDPE